MIRFLLFLRIIFLDYYYYEKLELREKSEIKRNQQEKSGLMHFHDSFFDKNHQFRTENLGKPPENLENLNLDTEFLTLVDLFGRRVRPDLSKLLKERGANICF